MNQITQSCKSLKPPICPKHEKATTVRIDIPKNSHLRHPNKIQREENTTNRGCQISPSSKNQISFASIPDSTSGQTRRQQKQEIRQQQYQQYTRKNYFRSKRKIAENTNIESNLTEKILPTSESASKQQQKRLKSKSALNYAKYFIKHVSIVPTEPSSYAPRNPNQSNAQCPEEYGQKQVEHLQQKKSTSIFSHEQREKSRKKISERLKSIKNVRSRSKNTCSIDKHKQLKDDKQVAKSPQKIAGNITSLSTNESNLLRMKARARNKRVILKVKQFNSRMPEDDICLMMSSKIDRSFSERKQVVEKIELHLELLNLLPAYVKQFKQIYEQSECWEELMYLVYKKFYIERLKVQLSLEVDPKNQNISCSNPFRFNFCLICDKDLEYFKNSLESFKVEEKLVAENNSIKDSLRNLYNHIIQKSGKHINLFEVDNFSEEIHYLMNEEIKLLAENEADSLESVRSKRIAFIIKSSLMIAFLNGENIQIESILTQNEYSYKMKTIYSKFIQYYSL